MSARSGIGKNVIQKEDSVEGILLLPFAGEKLRMQAQGNPAAGFRLPNGSCTRDRCERKSRDQCVRESIRPGSNLESRMCWAEYSP